MTTLLIATALVLASYLLMQAAIYLYVMWYFTTSLRRLKDILEQEPDNKPQ